MNITTVFLGGGLGSVLRYLCNLFFARHWAYVFPFATFFENIIYDIPVRISYRLKKIDIKTRV